MVEELFEIKTKIKELEIREKEIEQTILEQMRNGELDKTIDNEFYSVKYVAPTSKEHFNSKKFREENAEQYDNYIDIVNVNDCIRFRVK